MSLAVAGTAEAAEAWRITPGVQVRGTLTDNADLLPDNVKRSSFIIEVMPAIRIAGDTARAKLNLAYQINEVIDTSDIGRSEFQQQLNASGTFTAVEDLLFVDVAGNIAQEVISPFGARPPSTANFSPNRTEDRAFRVSPYLQGHLSVGADYTVRYSESWLRSSGTVDDSRIQEVNARISGDSTYTRLNLALEAILTRNNFKVGRDTDDNRLRALATYRVDPELEFTATGGIERSNISTLEHEQKPTYGGGFQWNPDVRTKVNGNWERRFFGDTWQYGAEHRAQHLVFSFSDTRDVTTDAQRLLDAAAASGVAYDLLYNLLTSRFPDPAERAIETQRILTSGAIPPDLNLPPDFLVGGVFVDRRIQASVALEGVRNTAAFSVYRGRREQLGGFTAVPGFPGGTGNIGEYGVSLALSHRLTPLSGVTGLVTWRKTTDLDTSEVSSRQWEARLMYNTQLGRNVGANIEVRHVQFVGPLGGASDYTENAVAGSVAVRF